MVSFKWSITILSGSTILLSFWDIGPTRERRKVRISSCSSTNSLLTIKSDFLQAFTLRRTKFSNFRRREPHSTPGPALPLFPPFPKGSALSVFPTWHHFCLRTCKASFDLTNSSRGSKWEEKENQNAIYLSVRLSVRLHIHLDITARARSLGQGTPILMRETGQKAKMMWPGIAGLDNNQWKKPNQPGS